MTNKRELKCPGGLREGQLYVMQGDSLLPVQMEAPSLIPRPTGEAFAHAQNTVETSMFSSPTPMYPFVKAEYPPEGGIYIYLKGLLHPTKGFPTPESVHANDTVKRHGMALIKMAKSNWLFALSLIYRPWLTAVLRDWRLMAKVTLLPFLLKPERYKRSTREIWKAVDAFTGSLGLVEGGKHDHYTLGMMVGTVLEYDDAYLLRIQDLANETTGELLSRDPRAEISRLYGILCDREPRPALRSKFGIFVKLLRFAMLIPRFDKAFRDAIAVIDWPKLQMDEADRYYVLRWAKYKFLGMTDEEREAEFRRLHDGELPKQYILQAK